MAISIRNVSCNSKNYLIKHAEFAVFDESYEYVVNELSMNENTEIDYSYYFKKRYLGIKAISQINTNTNRLVTGGVYNENMATSTTM